MQDRLDPSILPVIRRLQDRDRYVSVLRSARMYLVFPFHLYDQYDNRCNEKQIVTIYENTEDGESNS